MPKINWKNIGKVALGVGTQLFPVIGIIEQLAKSKDLTGKEKQNLAWEALHDELVASLLPAEVQDPRIEASVRRLVDAGVDFNNTVALVKSEHKK